MIVNFMVNSSPEIYVNKSVSISKQVNCNLKGEVDILHPTLIVKDVTIGSCNYMQIPDFSNRYYYIDSVITRNIGILEITGRVDVLMSHKAEILALGGIVARQEHLYNGELKDSDYTALNYKRIQTKAFSHEFNTNKIVLIAAGKGGVI